MLLADYRTGTRDLLHDPNANFYSVAVVDRWINRGRRQVAENGRCVRLMPPSTGSIASISVDSGGAGYTSATVTLSAPDSVNRGNVQATATANLSAGVVVSFTITNPGAGYVAPPTATIAGNGTGAAATPVLTARIAAVTGQEVYRLSDIATAIDTTQPGLGSLIGIQSISVAWGALKPTLRRRDFSWLQAYARSASMNYSGNPQMWAQYGQGVTGSFYLWPVPYQYAAMEVDCYFTVVDLTGAVNEVDLVPAPWNEAVFYYAAYLAYLNAQRSDDARMMLSEHQRMMTEARSKVTTDTIPDPYGEGD